MDYKKDIKIDEHDLKSEWLKQPALMVEYNDLYAVAIFERDHLKLKMDYIDAELDLKIRKNYEKYGFESKPTETAIKNTIVTQKKHQKLAKMIVSANRQVNIMSGAKMGFEQRKKALENLVSLFISGFYSEPRNKVRDIKELKDRKIRKYHSKNKKIIKKGKRNNKIGVNKQ